MILAALYLLAMLDGALCGYRSACKRMVLLDQQARRQAMLRGMLWAQIGAVLAVGAGALVWKLAPLRAGLIPDLQHAALRMLTVFGPFAAAALVLILTRESGSSAATLAARLAALRSLVALAAVLYAIVPAFRWESRALGVLVLALMLALEPLLNRIASLQPDFPTAD